MPGATLGMADYLSRHPTFNAPPPPSSVYDALFVTKTIENFTQACNSIRAGAWAPSAGFTDHTFVSHISIEVLNSIQKSVGIGIPGAMPRQGAISDSVPLDQSKSFTDNRYMPVGAMSFYRIPLVM